MGDIPPLSMNQTKTKLLEHLGLPPEVYDLMAKETDEAYKWLTSDRAHLKSNCVKDRPPYDWSDMRERSKDSAMERLSTSGSEQTSYYWKLARPTPECENWIARWFLYKVFRSRDSRNRAGHRRGEGESQKHSSGSRHAKHKPANKSSREVGGAPSSSTSMSNSYTEGPDPHIQQQSTSTGGGRENYDDTRDAWQQPHATMPAYTTANEYHTPATTPPLDRQMSSEGRANRGANTYYWDPVRDV